MIAGQITHRAALARNDDLRRQAQNERRARVTTLAPDSTAPATRREHRLRLSRRPLRALAAHARYG